MLAWDTWSHNCDSANMESERIIDRKNKLFVVVVLLCLVQCVSGIKLTAAAPADHILVLELGNITVEAGVEVSLSCRLGGGGGGVRGDRRCQWTFEGQVIRTDELTRHSVVGEEEGECSLVIGPVLPVDQGQYWCEAGQSVANTGFVRVISPPGQPHIHQARRGEVVEVGEGGQVEEREGGEVELTCETLGGRPAADIVWRHGDGSLVSEEMTELVTMVESERIYKTTSTLRLVPRGEETLVCTANSEAFPDYRVSTPVQLRVRSRPSVDLEVLTTHPLEVGDSLQLRCNYQAYPAKVNIFWFIKDEEIKGEKREYLTIEEVTKELDQSVIKCCVENAVGRTEKSLMVRVIHSPTLVTGPHSMFTKPGAQATFTCLADSHPPPRYVWVRADTQQLVGYGVNLTLTASELTEGEYVCKVFGDSPHSVTSPPATLHLERKPVISLVSMRLASLGEDVLLSCSLELSSPHTALRWFRRKEPVTSSSRYRLISSSSSLDLMISSVGEQDCPGH